MSETEGKFVLALKEHAGQFNLELSESVVASLCRYYGILQSWNARLHLVAPCSPEEFAVRHILESLLAVKYIPPNAHVADIGSGGGLPIIPCMIIRPDLHATLIESSARKAVFLREALLAVNVNERANIILLRYEDTQSPDVTVVTCRALDRFKEQLPAIVDWAPANSTLILFGGPSLQTEIESLGLVYVSELIPESEQRFIFVI